MLLNIILCLHYGQTFSLPKSLLPAVPLLLQKKYLTYHSCFLLLLPALLYTRHYVKKPTQELREKIIIEYAGLVKVVAGKLSIYLGYNVEYEFS